MKFLKKFCLFALLFVVFGTVKGMNILLIEYTNETFCHEGTANVLSGIGPKGKYHHYPLVCTE